MALILRKSISVEVISTSPGAPRIGQVCGFVCEPDQQVFKVIVQGWIVDGVYYTNPPYNGNSFVPGYGTYTFNQIGTPFHFGYWEVVEGQCVYECYEQQFIAPTQEEVIDFNKGWNAGAITQESLTGSMQLNFEAPTTNSGVVVGLRNGSNAGEHYSEIDYGWMIQRGFIEPVEFGVLQGGSVAFADGDVLSIRRRLNVESVESSTLTYVVEYLKNGVLVATSSKSSGPNDEFRVDTSFFLGGDYIKNTGLCQKYGAASYAGIQVNAVGAKYRKLTSTFAAGRAGITIEVIGAEYRGSATTYAEAVSDISIEVIGAEYRGSATTYAEAVANVSIDAVGAVYEGPLQYVYGETQITISADGDGHSIHNATGVSNIQLAALGASYPYDYGEATVTVNAVGYANDIQPAYGSGIAAIDIGSVAYLLVGHVANGTANITINARGSESSYGEGVAEISIVGFGSDEPFPEAIFANIEVPPFGVSAVAAIRRNYASIEMPIVGVEAYTGAIAPKIQIPDIGVDAEASLPELAVGNIEMPEIGVDGIAHVGKIASASVEMPALGVSAYTGAIVTVEMPAITAQVSGIVGYLAQAEIEMPAFTVQAEIDIEEFAVGNIEMPPFTMALSVSAEIEMPQFVIKGGSDLQPSVAGVRIGYSVNTTNNAVTELNHIPFLSIVKYRNYYIGISENGIYTIGGSDADGANIDSYITTGSIDFDTDLLKRLVRAYIDYRQSGDLSVTVKYDETADAAHEHTQIIVGAGNENILQRRIRGARGMKGEHIELTIANVNGGTFDINRIAATADVIRRRIRYGG